MPQNMSYMIAGYIAAAVVYVGYTAILLRRRADVTAISPNATYSATNAEGAWT